MAFTVETGAGVSGANSYASVAYVDTYHSDRGVATWTGTTNEKQAAIIKATDYITQKYALSFIGYRVYLTESYLDFPRYELYNTLTNVSIDSNIIPECIKQAVAILALEALSSDLNPSLERGGAIKRTKVDVIEVEYANSAQATTARPAIDGLLRPILKSSSNGINIGISRI